MKSYPQDKGDARREGKGLAHRDLVEVKGKEA